MKINIVIIILLSLSSCTTMNSIKKIESPAKLASCPAKPNCVSSEAKDPSQKVEPYLLALSEEEAWKIIKEVVQSMPRTKIVEEGPGYIHAECRSLIFRFVDNLELLVKPGGEEIAVRSAAVTGYSDFGVNRRRVERLRKMLVEKGVVKKMP